MEKDKISRIVKETIFERVGEFNGLKHADEITNEDNLGADMAMDLLDLMEVVIEVEQKIGKCILNDVINAEPYHELTVGKFIDMLYGYLKN